MRGGLPLARVRLYLSFNSLFEMQNQTDKLDEVIQCLNLSILYLRCPASMGGWMHLPKWLTFNSLFEMPT